MMAPVLFSMATDAWNSARSRAADRREARELEAFHRPAPELPLRSTDFRRFPRSGFGLVYRTGNGTNIDTFQGLVTKDLIGQPDTTIAVALTDAELDTIYRKVIQIRLFDWPEPHPPIDNLRSFAFPNTNVWFRVKAGSVEKEFSWNTGWFFPANTTDDWKRMWELIHMIQGMIERRPEYKSLPMAQGGYY